MEDMMKIVKQISIDISEQNNQMTKNITEMVGKIIDEKFTLFENRNMEIINILDNQESRIDILEREVRKKNIVIFGVEETERNYTELEKNLLSIIKETMNIDFSNQDLISVRRLGKKGEKTRPILFTVHAMRTKYEIFKNKKLLDSKKYYIMEDYPPKILAKRKLLHEKVTKLREEGTRAVIKYDKVVILNQMTNNKRKFLESPEHQSIVKLDQNHKKSSKKAANNNLSSYITRQQKPSK